MRILICSSAVRPMPAAMPLWQASNSLSNTWRAWRLPSKTSSFCATRGLTKAFFVTLSILNLPAMFGRFRKVRQFSRGSQLSRYGALSYRRSLLKQCCCFASTIKVLLQPRPTVLRGLHRAVSCAILGLDGRMALMPLSTVPEPPSSAESKAPPVHCRNLIWAYPYLAPWHTAGYRCLTASWRPSALSRGNTRITAPCSWTHTTP